MCPLAVAMYPRHFLLICACTYRSVCFGDGGDFYPNVRSYWCQPVSFLLTSAVSVRCQVPVSKAGVRTAGYLLRHLSAGNVNPTDCEALASVLAKVCAAELFFARETCLWAFRVLFACLICLVGQFLSGNAHQGVDCTFSCLLWLGCSSNVM